MDTSDYEIGELSTEKALEIADGDRKHASVLIAQDRKMKAQEETLSELEDNLPDGLDGSAASGDDSSVSGKFALAAAQGTIAAIVGTGVTVLTGSPSAGGAAGSAAGGGAAVAAQLSNKIATDVSKKLAEQGLTTGVGDWIQESANQTHDRLADIKDRSVDTITIGYGVGRDAVLESKSGKKDGGNSDSSYEW